MNLKDEIVFYGKFIVMRNALINNKLMCFIRYLILIKHYEKLHMIHIIVIDFP